MDGFFGIGIGELILIAIIALIVLGPERLPGALREVAKFIRYIRNLSQELTSQFGDEFKALEDLDPRRILQDAIESVDEEETAKEEAAKKEKATAKSTSAGKSTTNQSASAKKSTPAKSTVTKSTSTSTTKQETTKTAVARNNGTTDDAPQEQSNENKPKVEAEKDDPPKDAAHTSPTATTTEEQNDKAATASVTATAEVSADEVESQEENRIAPPQLLTEPNAVSTSTNGQEHSAESAETAPTSSTANRTTSSSSTRGKLALGETDPTIDTSVTAAAEQIDKTETKAVVEGEETNA